MKEITKDRRIKIEFDRLDQIFADLDIGTKATIDGLIRRAAYMRIALEDYETDLDANGYVEKFTQSPSAPPYDRKRPVAELYNAMNKNYQSIIKQLMDALPESVANDISKDILVFAAGAK